MYRLIVFLIVVATACGDNRPKDAPGSPADDAGIDAPGAVGACLDRPTDLPRAPSGQLPCELLPPGFTR
jgi:hypothetical protein